MSTYHVIVGDLHLGAADFQEDFLVWGPEAAGPPLAERPAAVGELDHRFARFLEHHARVARHRNLRPHLLLLGDVMDLWQVRRHGESVREAVRRVLEAHVVWLTALRQWAAGGGAITWVIGNHDQPLVDPEAWGLLMELLPSLNGWSSGAPTHWFADPEAGLYAEHGHQWDPFNRILKLSKPDATCLGYRVVRLLVNELEHLIPLIDKGADLCDILELALEAEGGGELRKVARLAGRLSRPVCSLLRELRDWEAGCRAPDFQRVSQDRHAALGRALRRAAEGRRGATIGPVPDGLRFIASGHTHEPGIAPIRTRRRGVLVSNLNPGTWRPVYTPSARRVVQRPTGIILAPDPQGWLPRLVEA
jgi:UDP-2,3-diacylglucosamine pyrophosphatase LpxH